MMHRSSSSSMVGGSCTCGMYHTQGCNSFSMLFSMNNGCRGYDEGGQMYSFSNSPSSSVDCTLSLGTPSTRLTSDSGNGQGEKKRSSRMSAFGWNILPSKQTPAPPSSSSKSHRGGSSGNSGGDPLLARRCANCDTTSTPLWRNGPRGPKSLCNACGIRFKKEERRATAAAATSSAGGMEAHQQMMNNTTWAHQAQKTPAYYYGNEYQFLQEDSHPNSWRFNVTDRPSFVHDFTR
ncbi:GATA transcription factor 18-like [Dorcoceras hygrometricum]|uniref:GATA transcription factor 18-like n=1 Tax=Dorcoceras hygrometricum TaxID=472368 RepID=A0A2Z7B1R4_9LAMI|nr:GATA transcription factor 18-like [Dorcoceras hygrometricum]